MTEATGETPGHAAQGDGPEPPFHLPHGLDCTEFDVVLDESALRPPAAAQPAEGGRRGTEETHGRNGTMTEKTHEWYDGMDRSDLDLMHVKARIGEDATIEGDLEPCDDTGGAMGVVMQGTKHAIPLILTGAQGNSPADGVAKLDLLWDGKVWRRMNPDDLGHFQAVSVEGRVYTVDRKETDDHSGVEYVVTRFRHKCGDMREMKIPKSAVSAYLVLVDGRPGEPGLYRGADGSLWCIDVNKGVWGIPRRNFRPRDLHDGDIPAEAWPLARVDGLTTERSGGEAEAL